MDQRKRRREYSDEFKAKLALEALRGFETLSKLGSEFKVDPKVIGRWKRQLIEGAPLVFSLGSKVETRSEEELTAPLYEQIGRLQMEIEWLKKKLALSR